jgi:hypothetical protein
MAVSDEMTSDRGEWRKRTCCVNKRIDSYNGFKIVTQYLMRQIKPNKIADLKVWTDGEEEVDL